MPPEEFCPLAIEVISVSLCRVLGVDPNESSGDFTDVAGNQYRDGFPRWTFQMVNAKELLSSLRERDIEAFNPEEYVKFVRNPDR